MTQLIDWLAELFAQWWLARKRASVARLVRNHKKEMQALRYLLDVQAQSLSLAEMENRSLERQLEAATDTIQAFGLHNRAIGAEAKTYLGQIVNATKP